MKFTRFILTIMMVTLATGTYAAKKIKIPTKGDSLKLEATFQAIDSIFSRNDSTFRDDDALMRFSDILCKEYGDDPKLMSGIAERFATKRTRVDLAIKRFRKIKETYPTWLNSYTNYAATLFDKSITVNPNSSLTRDPDLFDFAKAQIDSAKVVFPNNKTPYLWWIARCTLYSYNDSMQLFINNEVEDLRRKFPDINADYEAAKILENKRVYPLEMTNFEHTYLKDKNGEYAKDADGNFVKKWFFQAEAKRDSLTQFYYDKADINTLTSDLLTIVSNYYYKSTETKNITRAGRALFYKKGLERATLGMKKFPENDDFKYLQLWNAAELAKYHYMVANSDSVKRMGGDRKWDELDLCNSYATQALLAYDSLNVPADSIDYKAVLYAAMAKHYSGKYEDALQLYGQALQNMQYVKLKNRAPLYKAQYHDLDSLTAYQNMSDCYKSMNDYDKAIVQLNAVFDLRKGHGGQLKRTDLSELADLYKSLGRDTMRTQEERFAAFVAADSLYATIQDSIDARNPLFDNVVEGYVGMYQIQRLSVRDEMNKLSDYAERDNYLLMEIAEEVYRRIGPLPEKSNRELTWLGSALGTIWRDYYRKQDYKSALKYLNLEISYDATNAKKQRYKGTLDYIAKMAKRQRD